MKRRKSTATVQVIKDTNIVSESIALPVINHESNANNTSSVQNNIDPVQNNIDPVQNIFDSSKTTISKDMRDTIGTCLRGFVDTTYEELKSTLGEPLTGLSYDRKNTYEWILKFNCNSIATIYNWKTGHIPKATHQWYLGGTGIDVVEKVEMFLKKPTSRVE